MSELLKALRKEREDKLAATMSEQGIDVLAVIGNPWRGDYLRYATGVQIAEGHAVALIERGAGITLFLESPAETARIALEQPDIAVSWSSSAIAQGERALLALGTRAVALAPSHAMPLRLAKACAPTATNTGTSLMDRCMMRKTPAELRAVRRAAELADEGYQVFLKGARPGRPEYALVADIESFYRSQGCAENFQILGSGGREVRGMHPPGDKLVAAGDLVTTELTPCYEGYYAQICRTCVVGEPTPVQLKAFAVYNEALEAGIATVRPGIKASDIARAENDVFRKAGLGIYCTSEYTRVRGHGLGLYTDAKPQILEDVDVVIEEDMTLVVHPNTYHPDIGYFVHGDSLRVTATGCEVLIRTPRELFPVPAR